MYDDWDDLFSSTPNTRINVIITVPHAGCNLDLSSRIVRECDERAYKAALMLWQAIKKRGDMEVSLMANTEVPRKEVDMNRSAGNNTTWSMSVHDEIQKARYPTWVVDMHSFPTEEKWDQSFSPVKMAFLDMTRKSNGESWILRRKMTDESHIWVQASESNEIMRYARAMGHRSILVEVNESATDYTDEELGNDITKLAKAIFEGSGDMQITDYFKKNDDK